MPRGLPRARARQYRLLRAGAGRPLLARFTPDHANDGELLEEGVVRLGKSPEKSSAAQAKLRGTSVGSSAHHVTTKRCAHFGYVRATTNHQKNKQKNRI